MRESRFGGDLDNRISVNLNKKAFVVAPLTGNDCDTFQGPKLIAIGRLDTKLISCLQQSEIPILKGLFNVLLDCGPVGTHASSIEGGNGGQQVLLEFVSP